jgi:hypothetical protein
MVNKIPANLSAVVLAKAGTHNHHNVGLISRATLPCCGVWVPAFAGTTVESQCPIRRSRYAVKNFTK